MSGDLPGVDLALLVEDEGWGDEAHWRALIDRAVAAAVDVAELDVPDGTELSVVLTDDDRIRVINREHRGKDKPTNVLSFPGFAPDEEPGPLLGDIVVARQTVAREAAEEGKPMDNHFSHLIVHGMLHLFGYDHEEPGEAEEMEEQERLVLASLGIPDPYAETEVVSGPQSTGTS